MFRFNLQKRLSDWVAAGLVTSVQAERILKHDRAFGNSYGLTGVLVMGAFLIGLGVISMVAANWREIPDAVKLLADYGALVASAYFCWRSRMTSKELLFEGALVVFCGLILATIGLNAQIYHLNGKWYEAALLWSVLTLPAAAWARRSPLVHATFGTFLVAFFAWLLEWTPSAKLFGEQRAALAFCVPLLTALLTLLFRKRLGERTLTLVARQWVLLSAIGALGLVEISVGPSKSTAVFPYIPGWLLAVAIIAILALDSSYRVSQKRALFAALALFTLAMHVPLLGQESNFLSAVMTILTLLTGAMFVGTLENWRAFNGLLVLVGLRFLVLYFEAFGGLAATGVGLILSGVVVVGGAYLGRRFANELRERLAGRDA